MYERYWKLERAPFDHDRRPEAFFSGRLHGESLVKLKYLIEHGKGSAALIGASGSGKTHVLEMVRNVSSDRPVVHLIYPQLNPLRTAVVDPLLTRRSFRPHPSDDGDGYPASATGKAPL